MGEKNVQPIFNSLISLESPFTRSWRRHGVDLEWNNSIYFPQKSFISIWLCFNDDIPLRFFCLTICNGKAWKILKILKRNSVTGNFSKILDGSEIWQPKLKVLNYVLKKFWFKSSNIVQNIRIINLFEKFPTNPLVFLFFPSQIFHLHSRWRLAPLIDLLVSSFGFIHPCP